MTRGGKPFLTDTQLIVDQINAMADSLAPELLPNGRRNGTKWMFSGIPDHGQSESAWVNLSGPRMGQWKDVGNAAPGEDRGDMIDLLRLKLGLDQAGAFDEARRRLGMPVGGERAVLSQEEKQRRAAEARARAEARQAEQEAENRAKAKRAIALFLGGRPNAGTGAEFYLRGRGLHPGYAPALLDGVMIKPERKFPNALRFHDHVWHTPTGRKHPAMLCAVYRPNGEQIGTHRVYLSRGRDGWRGIEVPAGLPKRERNGWRKRILGTFDGGFIPINKGSSGKPMAQMPDEPIYVCEGPEDAVAIRMIKPEARIICSVTLGNIGSIVLPPQARSLVIVADRDEHETGQAALERAIAMQQARGVKVSIVMPPIEVNGRRIKDINDWVLALVSHVQSDQRAGAA